MFRQVPTLRPATLAVLERIAWTPTERGPLLIVGPDRMIRTALGGMQPPRLSGFPGTGGINVLEVGDALKRKLARTPGLSALVPETLWTLVTPTQRLTPYDALLALAASLEPRQWQLLCGPNGLGARDLTQQQQGFFQSALPPGLTTTQSGQIPTEAIAQGRLHVARKIDLGVTHFG
nr:hypothetical protein [Armatimonas sp.]